MFYKRQNIQNILILDIFQVTHFPAADSSGGCTRRVQKLAPSTMDDYGCIDTTMGHLVFGDGYVGLPHVQHMGVSENTVYPQIAILIGKMTIIQWI